MAGHTRQSDHRDPPERSPAQPFDRIAVEAHVKSGLSAAQDTDVVGTWPKHAAVGRSNPECSYRPVADQNRASTSAAIRPRPPTGTPLD